MFELFCQQNIWCCVDFGDYHFLPFFTIIPHSLVIEVIRRKWVKLQLITDISSESFIQFHENCFDRSYLWMIRNCCKSECAHTTINRAILPIVESLTVQSLPMKHHPQLNCDWRSSQLMEETYGMTSWNIRNSYLWNKNRR